MSVVQNVVWNAFQKCSSNDVMNYLLFVAIQEQLWGSFDLTVWSLSPFFVPFFWTGTIIIAKALKQFLKDEILS